MKKSVNAILVFALLLVAAVAISGCAQYGGQQAPQTGQEAQPVAPAEAAETQLPQPPASPPQEQTQPAQEAAPQAGAEPAVHVVNITVGGFVPTIVVLKAGDKVTWVNTDEDPHWPASAAHPTHTVYPGSGISKCGTAEQADIFDACKELAQGESFTFMFKEKGTWSYHDHLESTDRGRVVVE